MFYVRLLLTLLLPALLVLLFSIPPAFVLADNDCPRPPGVPAGARYSCPTHTQPYQPSEIKIQHPGGSPGRTTSPTAQSGIVCQQWPGHPACGPFTGTGPQTPLGPNFQRQPQGAGQQRLGRNQGGEACWTKLPPNKGKLCAENGHFWDENGRIVILRGVNVAGTSKIPPFLPLPTLGGVLGVRMQGGIMITRDFDFLSHTDVEELNPLVRWGLNVIRLLFVWEAYEPFPGEVSERYLQMLARIAEEAWKRRIYTIIDFHQDAFARWVDGGCGEGFPQWAVPRDIQLDWPRNDGEWYTCKFWMQRGFLDPKVHRSFANFYNGGPLNLGSSSSSQAGRPGARAGGASPQASLRERYLRRIGQLARYFGDLPGVIGFDVLNEPFSDVVEAELNRLYADVAEEIRQQAPATILFLEPNLRTDTGVPTLVRPPAGVDNVAYAPHFYELGVMSINAYTGGPQEWGTKLAFQAMQGTAQSWQAPLFVGEFGAPAAARNVENYIDLLYDQLDMHLASGAQWSYTPGWTPDQKDGWNGEDLSIMALGGGSNAEGYRPQLFRPRPYPQQISGLPQNLRVVSQRDAYTIDLTWLNRPGQTVIYVPQPPRSSPQYAAQNQMSLACRQALNPVQLFMNPSFLSTILGCLGDTATEPGIWISGGQPSEIRCQVEQDAFGASRLVCQSALQDRALRVVVNQQPRTRSSR